MSKSVLLAIVCLGISAWGALAADVTIKSQLSQSFSADSNYQMQPNPPGPTYLPVSNLLFDTVARTPTMRFAATVNLSYRTYFGPGAENLLPGLDRGIMGRFEKTTALTTYKVAAARQYRQASQLQLAETGVNTIGGDVITSWVESIVTHQLSGSDLLTWATRATNTEFTSPTGTPSLDITTTGAWRHRLTPLTELTPSIQFESINYGNSSNTEVMIWRGLIGAESRLTKRLKFKGSVGVAHIALTQDGGGNGPNPAQLASGSAADWLADVLLSYNLNSRNDVSFAAAQSVGPDTLGQIRKVQIVGVILSHRLNQYSGLSFSTQASHQTSVANVTDLYSAGVSYGLRLAPEWFMDLSYRLRHRTGGNTDPATSNAVFVSVTRDVTILAGGTDRTPVAVAEDPTLLMASPGEWAITRRSELPRP